MMLKKDVVVVGETYLVKVSARLAPVRLESESPYGGWVGRNTPQPDPGYVEVGFARAFHPESKGLDS